MSQSAVKTGFKYGCIGCVGIVGLIVLIFAAMAGTAWMRVNSEQVDDRSLTEELHPAATPGTLELDLQGAGFHIDPCKPGEPLRVDADYDTRSFELETHREDLPDGGWKFRVTFRRVGSSSVAGLRQLFGGHQPRVSICLPADVPMALDLNGAEGALDVDLGGLWLTTAEIEMNKGGLELDVSSPLREPVESLTVRVMMGGGDMRRLGNASPGRLIIDRTMGGGDIDLRGQWVRDAEITIRHRMGGGGLRLPRDAIIEGLPGHVRSMEQYEVRPPTLRFSVSSSMGGLDIR